MTRHVFDHAKLELRLAELRNQPPFQPEKYEPRYTVTQLFEDGTEVTLHYVIRDGHNIYYKAEQRHIS